MLASIYSILFTALVLILLRYYMSSVEITILNRSIKPKNIESNDII